MSSIIVATSPLLSWRHRQLIHISHVSRLLAADGARPQLCCSYSMITLHSISLKHSAKESFAASHLFPFCHTVAKFCLQQAQKRRGDPQGPIVSVHPRSAALSAAVKAIFSSSRMWDLFVKSLYAYCDGRAGVKIKGSPDQMRSFLLRPPFWSPGRKKKACFLSLTCWIKIEK